MYQKKSKTKQFVAGLLGATLALSFAFALTAKADTVSDLTAQINSLLATITSLQSKLAAVQGGSTAGTGTTFASDLSVGSKGADVMNLQKVLNMSADTKVAVSGAGSPGNETSTFGPATKAAVIKFQKKNGVSGTGYVGPLTRAKLNAMAGSTTTTTTTTTPTTTTTTTTTTNPVVPAGTGLTVSSPVQPGVTIAPQGTSRVPFTKVTLTAGSDGDVTVNSLTVQRTGLASDSAFASIVLLDENGLQIGTSKTFNSNHQTTLGDPFVVSRGTSRTLTVAGNMAAAESSYSGQVASLTVVGVNTAATVSGALPITGAGQTINSSLTVGTADLYRSSYDPASNLSKNIGDTAIKFSGIKITAGSAEDVTLWSIRWNQTGSVGSGDLANVVTVLDNQSYPTVISTDGKYYTTLFPNGIVIQKGFSKDLYVQGDVVGSNSASRTIEFDLYNASDLYLSGNTYNFGLAGTGKTTGTLSASARSIFQPSSTPFYAGSTVTLSAGTATTIGKSTTIAPAANIAINVPNQILGAYDTNIKGEPISVQQTIIHFTSSAANLGTLTSVSLIDKNGAVVAGPKDATLVTGTDQDVTFTDTVTYPVGIGSYTIVGKLPTNYTNGSTINASTTPSADWSTVKGQVTGNSLTLTNAVFSMNTMTVRTASLAISASSNPAAQTVVAGSQGFIFTNLQFDATQSGEDLRISTIPTTLTRTTGANTDINSCQVYDNLAPLTTGSNVVNPAVGTTAYTFTLDQSLTIPKGTVKTLAIKCNISGAATAFAGHWDMTTANTGADAGGTGIAVSGTTSTGSVVASGSATGASMSVGAASLAVSTDPSSPSYTIVSAGTTGVPIGVYKFRATNDSINLQRVVLRLTNSASSSDQDLVLVHLFDGNTQVGTATFTGGAVLATSTFAVPVLLTRGTDKFISATVDLANTGGDATTPIPSGHLLAVDIENSTATENTTYGTGISSGTAVNAVGSTAVAGIRIFKSFPTFADIKIGSTYGLPSSGVADGRLLRFSVTADSKGPVSIEKFTLSVSTTSVIVSGVNIYAFTDQNFSNAITAGLNAGGQLMTTNVAPISITNTAMPFYTQTTGSASSTLQIPAGTTRYFEVRATVSGSTATSYSVVTTLLGDTGYPAVTTPYFMTTIFGTTTQGVSGSAADATGNSTLNHFLWSPNSTTTPGIGNADWTNGFTVAGLPSNGIIQARTN